MAEQADDLDDVRYQHHLKHRGRANQRIFWIAWSIITAVVLTRIIRRASRWRRRRFGQKHFSPRPARSLNSELLNRATASVKASFYLPMPRLFRFIFPTSTLGRLILLVSYVGIIASTLLAVDAPIFSQHFLDDVAFRAAWMTLTQIPLVYFLSIKTGPINLLAGISYERVNWMHRWIGRILLLSATAHVAIMKSSISTLDILQSHDKGMTVVRFGIGAYSTLLWIAVTSILPLRRWSYRAFYLNHWISTIAFLIIIFQHIPSYARNPIYLAISFITLDKLLFVYFFCRNNISFRPIKFKLAKFRRGPGRGVLIAGYRLEMVAPPSSILGLPTQTRNSTTILRISNLPLSWKPGQHVRIYVPAFGAFESHPFTPANCSAMPPPPLPPRKDVEQRGSVGLLAHTNLVQTSEMLLFVRAHAGFTRRLAEYHAKWLTHPCPNATQPTSDLSAYIDGPYGSAPAWEEYENLVLIATSSGVSFTLAIVDHLEQLCFIGSENLRTKSVKFLWILRHVDPQLEETVKDLLLRYSTMLRESNLKVEAEFYITCADSSIGPEMVQYDQFAHLRHQQQQQQRQQQQRRNVTNRPPLRIRNPDEIYDEWDREAEMEALGLKEVEPFEMEVDDRGRYSFESDDSSEMSTLIEDVGQEEHEEDPFSDAYTTNREDAEYRPLPTARTVQRDGFTHDWSENGACQCAVIQHQKRKLKMKSTSQDFINRNYGTRPDLGYMLSQAVPSASIQKSMVAVCANSQVTRDVQSVVVKINMDFALGTRKSGVKTYIEGFG